MKIESLEETTKPDEGELGENNVDTEEEFFAPVVEETEETPEETEE